MFTLSQKPTTDDRLPPRLPSTPRRERVRVTSFRGLTAQPSASWEISAMRNLSPRRLPALSTRPPREMISPSFGMAASHGMLTVGKDLYFLQGTTLYRKSNALQTAGNIADATLLGVLSDTDQCMVVFGDYLLLFPDKKYLLFSEGVLRSMELDTGVIEQVEFNGTRIILPPGMTWTSLGFLPGDSIHVINEDDSTPAPEGYYRIRELRGNAALLMSSFSALYTSNARFTREIPNLKGAAVCGNRLFGFAGKQIYMAAEGTPFAFQSAVPDGRGAATLASNTAGDITACVSWQGYMVCFKETSILRVLGNRADSFSLIETPAPGIPATMADTLSEVGGELYYHGDTGIYRYTHATQKPERIGQFAAGIPVVGHGGTDGTGYYLDLAEKNQDQTTVWSRYLYMPQTGDWYVEDPLPSHTHVTLNGYLCTQAVDGRIWISRSDGPTPGQGIGELASGECMQSSVTFHPDYYSEPDGYRPVNLFLRASSRSEQGELRVLASFADGRAGLDAENPIAVDRSARHIGGSFAMPQGAVELAHFAGRMKDRLLRIPITVPRCDHMILSLEMSGDWEIGALTTEYEVTRR